MVKTTTLIMPVVFFFKPRTVTAIGTHQPIHGGILRLHRSIRWRRSQKAYESSQGASYSVGGRRRLLADIESQPEFPIPHRILRLVSDYSEDASD